MHDSLVSDSAVGGLTPRPVNSLLGGLGDVVPITPPMIDPIDSRLGSNPVNLNSHELGAPNRVIPVSRDPPSTFDYWLYLRTIGRGN